MLIGDVARRSGLSKDGLRHYEALGLIHSTPRRAGSRTYRDYDDSTLMRLSLIALGKRLNFSLKEMAEVIDGLIDETMPLAERQRRMAAKLVEVDARITDLTRARAELAEILAQPDKTFVNPKLRDLGLMLDDRAKP